MNWPVKEEPSHCCFDALLDDGQTYPDPFDPSGILGLHPQSQRR